MDIDDNKQISGNNDAEVQSECQGTKHALEIDVIAQGDGVILENIETNNELLEVKEKLNNTETDLMKTGEDMVNKSDISEILNESKSDNQDEMVALNKNKSENSFDAELDGKSAINEEMLNDKTTDEKESNQEEQSEKVKEKETEVKETGNEENSKNLLEKETKHKTTRDEKVDTKNTKVNNKSEEINEKAADENDAIHEDAPEKTVKQNNEEKVTINTDKSEVKNVNKSKIKNNAENKANDGKYHSNKGRNQGDNQKNKDYRRMENETTACVIKNIYESTELTLSSNDDGIEARVKFFKNYLTENEANELYTALVKDLDWQQKESFNNFGEKYPEPRLTYWFGKQYKYSSVTWPENKDWHPKIEELRSALSNDSQLSPDAKRELNSVMCNYYRDNNDSIGWHSDDEVTLGRCPKIASISLGQTRVFEVCKREEYYNRKGQQVTDQSVFPGCTIMYRFHLGNGSLILMEGSVQDDWLHRVPKEDGTMDGRINLTFRYIVDEAEEKQEIARKKQRAKTRRLEQSGRDLQPRYSKGYQHDDRWDNSYHQNNYHYYDDSYYYDDESYYYQEKPYKDFKRYNDNRRGRDNGFKGHNDPRFHMNPSSRDKQFQEREKKFSDEKEEKVKPPMSNMDKDGKAMDGHKQQQVSSNEREVKRMNPRPFISTMPKPRIKSKSFNENAYPGQYDEYPPRREECELPPRFRNKNNESHNGQQQYRSYNDQEDRRQFNNRPDQTWKKSDYEYDYSSGYTRRDDAQQQRGAYNNRGGKEQHHGDNYRQPNREQVDRPRNQEPYNSWQGDNRVPRYANDTECNRTPRRAHDNSREMDSEAQNEYRRFNSLHSRGGPK